VTAEDQDAGTTLAYSIGGGADAARFTIDAEGNLAFLTAPDFEAPADADGDNVYEVTVRVSDGSLTSTLSLSVRVDDVNEWTPVISGPTASLVPEGTTTVATVTAEDTDGTATLTYSITGGADAAKFAIDPISGALTFLTEPNFEAPTDANADNVYHVTVRVSDGTYSDEQAIAVSVTNVNEAPTITSNGGGATASVSVAENQTAVTTVTSTDPDAGATKTYGIVGGADAAKFAINPSTGALTFVPSPNYESPNDSGANNVYDVIVRVSDGSLTDDQAIAVSITNVNEAPVIGTSTDFSVSENTQGPIPFTATDPEGSALTFSVQGTDASLFTMSSGGSLSFANIPDYEWPTDLGADNIYNVVVQVTDGTFSVQVPVIVRVTNTNDSRPFVTNDSYGTTTLSGSVYTIQGSGTDWAGTSDDFHFAQSRAGASATVVARLTSMVGTDAATGGVMFRDGMAADAAYVQISRSKGGSIVFRSRDSSGATTTTIASASPGSSVNWLRVQKSGNAFTASYSSNGTTWTSMGSRTVTMTDPRGGLTVSSNVSISTLATGTFESVSLTGLHSALTGIDVGGAASFSVNQGATAVSSVMGTDTDGATLSYSINGGSDSSKFAINSSTGILTFVSAPSYSSPTDSNGDNIYQVVVQMSDGSYTGSRTYNVRVVAPATASSSLSLSSAFNRQGMVSDGSTFTTGWDGSSSAYSRNLMGTSMTWDGTSFSFATSSNNAVSAAGQYIAASASQQGQYSSLKLLGSAVNGNQANQTFTIYYTDLSTETVTISMSDWFTPQNYSGESKALTMSYRNTSSGGRDNRTFYLYGYSLPLNTSKSFLGVQLPNNSKVVVAAMSLSTSAALQSDLGNSFNQVGITTSGTTTTTGLDGAGYTYNSASLGSTLAGLGYAYALGTANQYNAVSSIGQTIGLTRGYYSKLRFLAAAVNGHQANQTFVVTYTDGTTQTLTQSISDWCNPQSYSGETTIKSGIQRNTASGGADTSASANMYAYSINLDPTKRVRSITLPNQSNVKLFGINLIA